jgi:phosphinothricin acetyltransferase
MQIRPARDDDFDTIAAITNHYIATTSIHFGYEPVSGESLRAHRGNYPWFVAEDDQRVVGYAKAGVWRERAAYQWTCETGLYVAHDARARGIGRALYDTLLAECAARGYRSAVAGITLPNRPSIALHERCGFTHVGTFADAGWKNGAWHAVDWWQKRFATGPEGPYNAP